MGFFVPDPDNRVGLRLAQRSRRGCRQPALVRAALGPRPGVAAVGIGGVPGPCPPDRPRPPRGAGFTAGVPGFSGNLPDKPPTMKTYKGPDDSRRSGFITYARPVGPLGSRRRPAIGLPGLLCPDDPQHAELAAGRRISPVTTSLRWKATRAPPPPRRPSGRPPLPAAPSRAPAPPSSSCWA
jgi:hypothetical protein